MQSSAVSRFSPHLLPIHRPWPVTLVAAALLAASGWTSLGVASRQVAAIEPKSETVALIVDFGDGAELRLKSLAYRPEMTVLDAVQAASAHPHGVKFKLRGAGATAFVTQIGDLKNEGGGAKSRNWIYSVEDEQPDVGIGSFRLKPGHVILWKFDTARYNR